MTDAILHHCQNCNVEWYFPRPAHYCPECDSEDIYSYPEPKFKPQQWVRYSPNGPLYTQRNEQIAEIRPDGKGGWLYVLPKWVQTNLTELASYPEDALETTWGSPPKDARNR